LSAETTTIFVRDGWLIVDVAEPDVLRPELPVPLEIGCWRRSAFRPGLRSEPWEIGSSGRCSPPCESGGSIECAKPISRSCSPGSPMKPSPSRSGSSGDENP